MESGVRRTRIKFCGMMSASDVALAVEAGVDAVGVIVAPSSPRYVGADALTALAEAIPPLVARIGVATAPTDTDASRLRGLGFTLQFSGEESSADCGRLAGGAPYIKAFHLCVDAPDDTLNLAALADYSSLALLMFDSRIGAKLGGTGIPFAWNAIAPLARRRRVIVSGGLTPTNVAACIRSVRPYAVDVRSGIETGGRKDPEKMRAFVQAVREADAD